MRFRSLLTSVAAACTLHAIVGGAAPLTEVNRSSAALARRASHLIALWSSATPAFGVFVPQNYTRDVGRQLAANPLYDFVFLNLEGAYDADAVGAVADGLRRERARAALLVRIPPVEAGGEAATRARVREALELGADGITIPHVRNVQEARLAIAFFADAGARVWSPANPAGDTIAMLMIEDPGALSQAAGIADLPGYSVLACGIGSLTRALNNDREAGEAGTLKVLAETRRVSRPNMLTATAADVEKRIKEGFLGILAIGPDPDAVIRRGRAAAGRR